MTALANYHCRVVVVSVAQLIFIAQALRQRDQTCKLSSPRNGFALLRYPRSRVFRQADNIGEVCTCVSSYFKSPNLFLSIVVNLSLMTAIVPCINKCLKSLQAGLSDLRISAGHWEKTTKHPNVLTTVQITQGGEMSSASSCR